METWDAIRSRRNVREFAERRIPAEELDLILEAGRRTPSSRNQQPWDLVVVTDRQRLEALSRVWRGAGHVATSAATVAVVAPVADDDAARSLLHFDLGQLIMAMALAAADQGIGSGHAWVEDQALAHDLLGFPEDRFLAWLLALGYPADQPLRPIRSLKRRPFDDVVHREHW